MPHADIALFEQKEIRKTFHDDEWWFSITDIVELLTDSSDPAQYIKKMRARDSELQNNWGTICTPLEMTAKDGKKRKILSANTEGVLRIVQSIPSPKAEPFKRWLAKVGNERIQEMSNPEIALNRSRELWQKHGRSEKWIEQRMTGQETRNKLTDYWSDHGVEKGQEYAILTNIIHEEWAEIGIADHKEIKGLAKSHNLRDHMSEEELLFTQLAELSTRRIALNMNTEWLEENKIPAKKWGEIARNAKKEFESQTGHRVVTGENFLPPKKEKKKLPIEN